MSLADDQRECLRYSGLSAAQAVAVMRKYVAGWQCLCCGREFESPRLLCVEGCSGWVDRKPDYEAMTIRTVSAQEQPNATETNVNEQRT